VEEIINNKCMEPNRITLEEVYEKYNDIPVFFSSYYKYSFTFTGEKDGVKITATCGGDSGDIYRLDVDAGVPYLLRDLEPEYFSAKGSFVDDIYRN